MTRKQQSEQRRRARQAARAAASGFRPPVAFAGTRDQDGISQAHTLAQNPNTAKRNRTHANVTGRANSGARRKNEPRILLTQTRFHGRTLVGKNLQRFETEA